MKAVVWNMFLIYVFLSGNIQVATESFQSSSSSRLFFKAQDITRNALTNFGDGRPVFGVESLIENYVELSEDLKGGLPVEFSICSSVLIKYVTTNQYFYQLYNVGLSASVRNV